MKRVLIALRRMPRWLWALPVAAALGAVPAIVSLFDKPASVAPTPVTGSVLGPLGGAYVSPETFQWPLDPPDRPHPVRATFGEPRGLVGPGIPREATDRAGLIRASGPLQTPGERLIHTGIDIAAPDGTPVFAVRSGTAFTGGGGDERYVIVGNFGYWHLSDAVATGTRVIAFVTVIGRIYPGQGHVHLSRFVGCTDRCTENSRVQNPLVSGGITPFRDTAAPRLGALVVYNQRGRRVPREAVSGPVALFVNAADIQGFGGGQTGIYTLSYRITRFEKPGVVIGPIRVLKLDELPAARSRNGIYTSGSTRRSTKTAFTYRLTIRSPTGDGLLHTERLAPGRYTVHVSASDVSGNRTEREFGVTVVDPRLASPASTRAPQAGPRRI